MKNALSGLFSFLVLLALIVAGLSFFGIGPGATYLDEYRIQGRWEYEFLGTKHMNFLGDGKIQDEGPLITSDGTYELSGGRVYLQFEGLLWGTNKSNWGYEFEDWDRLVLKDCSSLGDVTLTLRRVD